MNTAHAKIHMAKAGLMATNQSNTSKQLQPLPAFALCVAQVFGCHWQFSLESDLIIMSLTNEITTPQFEHFKSMSVNEIALSEMGELSTESVKLAYRWFNRCRAIEAKLGHENRLLNFATWKPESKRISNEMEAQEVAHYEG